jgi:hypothetical protein
MSATMEKDEIIKIKDSLWELCMPWESITHETIASLGKEDALHIMDYHVMNWIAIIKEWIPAKYSEEEQNSIIYMQFFTLFKETLWLQFLFQTGNYSLVYRNLRYLLEMMAQAHYVDLKYPNLVFDEQIEKTIEIEEKIYGWNLIKNVLCNVLNSNEKDLDEKYKETWTYLNKHVHASAKRMKMVDEIDPSSHFIDSYNETLARDTLKIVDMVFDMIYLIIFSRFPSIYDLLLQDEFENQWKIHSPDTIKYTKIN